MSAASPRPLPPILSLNKLHAWADFNVLMLSVFFFFNGWGSPPAWWGLSCPRRKSRRPTTSGSSVWGPGPAHSPPLSLWTAPEDDRGEEGEKKEKNFKRNLKRLGTYIVFNLSRAAWKLTGGKTKRMMKNLHLKDQKGARWIKWLINRAP